MLQQKHYARKMAKKHKLEYKLLHKDKAAYGPHRSQFTFYVGDRFCLHRFCYRVYGGAEQMNGRDGNRQSTGVAINWL